MWTERELARIGKTYINDAAVLEDYLDERDLNAIKSQGTTYYNLKDKIFAPKVLKHETIYYHRNRI